MADIKNGEERLTTSPHRDHCVGTASEGTVKGGVLQRSVLDRPAGRLDSRRFHRSADHSCTRDW
jgi:hypothetical protein